MITNGKNKISNPHPSPHLVRSRVVYTHTHRQCEAQMQRGTNAQWERRMSVCVRSVMRLKHCMRLMSLIFRTWMRLAATDKQQSWMLGDNKQTNRQTNSFTHDVKGEWDGPRVGAKRLVYQMPVQGRRTTLLDAITQAHSTAHMEQNATRIIPLTNSLLPGTYFFIHLWTFHLPPWASRYFGFVCGLGFFRCNQVSVEFWIYFGTYIFQSLVVLDLTQTGYLGILGVILDLYFFTWYFGFILGLCRFSL